MELVEGFSVRDVHFVPGFPVMAHPMIESLLDTRYAHLHRQGAWQERSVIVFGAMEATLTPLMEALESRFPGVKVFSLPSVDHPQWGRHIELGVKGAPTLLDEAYPALLAGLAEFLERLPHEGLTRAGLCLLAIGLTFFKQPRDKAAYVGRRSI